MLYRLSNYSGLKNSVAGITWDAHFFAETCTFTSAKLNLEKYESIYAYQLGINNKAEWALQA